jgi:hypothetical protein
MHTHTHTHTHSMARGSDKRRKIVALDNYLDYCLRSAVLRFLPMVSRRSKNLLEGRRADRLAVFVLVVVLRAAAAAAAADTNRFPSVHRWRRIVVRFLVVCMHTTRTRARMHVRTYIYIYIYIYAHGAGRGRGERGKRGPARACVSALSERHSHARTRARKKERGKGYLYCAEFLRQPPRLSSRINTWVGGLCRDYYVPLRWCARAHICITYHRNTEQSLSVISTRCVAHLYHCSA